MIFKIPRYILIITVLTWLFTQNCYAQFTREEIIINNKIYRPFSNYILLSTGTCFNINQRAVEKSGEVGYVFRIQQYFFQLGYHVSSNAFFLYRSPQKLNNLFLMYGFRKENVKRNIDLFIGPSYAYGSKYAFTDTIGNKWYSGFSTVGIKLSFDYDWKIFYDIGFGLNAYAEWNKYYPIVGIKINIYFSGAYRGSIEEKDY